MLAVRIGLSSLLVAGCGPAVGVPGGDSGSGAGSGSTGASSEGGPTGEPNPGAVTGETTVGPTTGGVQMPTIEGPYYVVLRPVIAPSTPFQFVGSVKSDGSTITMSLVPLSLELNSVDTPRELVPLATEVEGTIGPQGEFSIPVPHLELVGNTNPITGSDIVASLQIDGVIDGNLLCARVEGMVTVPASIDLNGSTFGAMPIDTDTPRPSELPLPGDIGCP